MKKIIVNGQEFSSVEEMPPDVRRKYEEAMRLLADRDGDGIPDIVQGGLGGMSRRALRSEEDRLFDADGAELGGPGIREIRDLGDGLDDVEIETSSTEITIDGEKYSSADEIPPEARDVLQRIMKVAPELGEDETTIEVTETSISEWDSTSGEPMQTRHVSRVSTGDGLTARGAGAGRSAPDAGMSSSDRISTGGSSLAPGRSSSSDRISPRDRMYMEEEGRGGRGRLGWFVAFILALVLIWVLFVGG